MVYISQPVVQSLKLAVGKPLNQSSVYCDHREFRSKALKKDPYSYRLSLPGRKMIRNHEGLARLRVDGLVQAYKCPAGVWTIGYGSTGPNIRKGTIWTVDQCRERFNEDIQKFETYVRKSVGWNIKSQEQFDALVSFCYNVGPGNFKTSTLLRLHNDGDYHGAAEQFHRWKFANGKVLKGLIKRRAEEADLYLTGWQDD